MAKTKRTRRVTRPTVVFVASEAYPYCKTGGLADVTGALGRELVELGCRVLLILPKYYQIPEEMIRPTSRVIRVPVGHHPVQARIWEGRAVRGVETYLLDIPAFYDRASLYGEKGQDYADNCARFAALSRGALELVKKLRIRPHIMHAHDWQTALVPLYLKSLYRRDPHFAGTRSVFTIHNLSYQGRFELDAFAQTGLPKTYLSPRYLEYFGELRLLKGGLVAADWITTVSPTYEKEIRTEAFGCGLDGVIRSRAANLTGILNGIDVTEWDPTRDELIPARYSTDDLHGKSVCKRALQREMGLRPETGRPLIGLMSRLVEQKGIAQAVATIPWLAEAGAAVAVLGEGDPAYELEISRLATRWPDRIAIRIGYNNELAHLMQAGIDYLIMPSIFEPCGLVQMYALRYGSIPVVRGVGGLADTVTDYTAEPDRGTGFIFHSAAPGSLQAAVHRAMSVYRHRRIWPGLRRRGMRQDFSWRPSAERYLDLYRQVVMAPRTPIKRNSSD